MSERETIPVVVVAGFLGAGKTSTLMELLPMMEGGRWRPYVILNDYVNAEIDQERLRQVSERVSGIAAGCVCCEATEGLEEAMMAIPDEPGVMVFLEANGTTDPYELLVLLTLSPRLRPRFGPVYQVVVIHEGRWQKRILPGDRRLELAQLRTASVVLTNRREQASYRQQVRVAKDLAEQNGRAWRASVAELAVALEQGGRLEAVAGEEREERVHRHRHSALRVEMPEGVREVDLRMWLLGLPREVLRVKGLVRLDEGEWCYFNRTDDAYESLSLVRIAGREGLEGSAVLIGVGLEQGEVGYPCGKGSERGHGKGVGDE